MKASYKMTVVALCGVMLLASGCGAKTETSASSAVESASEAVSEVSSAVSEAASEAPAESKAESKAETKAESKPAKKETAASSKVEETKQEKSEPVSEAAPAEQAAPAETASLETALKYVGKDVNKLYSAIGKPASSEYASSCIGNGEDGLLYYDGFTVTTYRENGKETVQDAY